MSERLITKTEASFGRESLSAPDLAAQKEIQHARDLALCVAKVNVFGQDSHDEFTIQRENGETEGIFKTWAVPIIPFIESGEVSKLAEVTTSLPEGASLLDSLPPELQHTIENWHDTLNTSPTKLWQTLEKSRVAAEVADRRLAEIFAETPLSENPHERVAQLLARVHVAFGYAAPFYHIEAMVGDENDTPLNPAHLEGENGGGGALDVVALTLPSAISTGVRAEKLNWNDLSWDAMEAITNNLPEEERTLVLQLAGLLDVNPSDIVFAANVLEFIPVSVGGKKGDLPQEQALNLIKNALNNKPDTKGAVVRDMNALIRFRNWFPLIHTQDNFDSGTLWSYAAVCDTASQLLSEVKSQGNVFVDGFNEIFAAELSEQLSNLDATSAKGRFLFSLLQEGKFSDNIVQMYGHEMSRLTEIVGTRIAEKKQEEAIVDVLTPMPRALVGGKAAGIAEAAMLIPEENFVNGQVLTSEWVHDWIMGDPNIATAIDLLNNQTDTHVRHFWGQEIQRMIQRLPVSPEISRRLLENIDEDKTICVRSSSFDEDTQVNGSAAGIYESEIDTARENIDHAIQSVVSSFFSPNAIDYRKLHGFLDVPSFALLVTPFHEGPGGALFTKGDGATVDIGIAESPQHIVDASAVRDIAGTHTLSQENTKKLVTFALDLEKVRGSNIDMEFVEEKGKLILLQARALRAATNGTHHENEIPLEITQDIMVDALGQLNEIEPDDNAVLRLHLNPNINIDQFQGDLFRWLVKSNGKVAEIVLSGEIPSMSHFANICLHLGISIIQA